MKNTLIAFLLSLIMCPVVFAQQYDDLQERTLDTERLKLLPIQGKNYFFLQSVDDKTQIVIGDLTAFPKRIILIQLKEDYTTIRSVAEYLPERKELRVGMESDSKLFTKDIVKLKRDIITGAIYKGNYTNKMKSYGELESVFKQNDSSKIFAEVYGFSVKLAEVDESNKIMAIYTFGNHIVLGYYLQFKTFYFRENPISERFPKLKYSVYSKNTHDPIIQEYVEALFKIRKPASSYVK